MCDIIDHVSIKQRAYPTPEQVPALDTHFSHARFVYNIGVDQWKMRDRASRERGVKLSSAIQQRQLTEARSEFPWLKEGSRVVQVGALRDLERAITNFFKGRADFPTYHKKWSKDSFVIRDVVLTRYNRRYGGVLVPKAGFVKFRITRTWSDIESAKSARVTLKHGNYHVSFTTIPGERRENGTGVVGLDRGVAVSVMTSDGDEFIAPSLTLAEQHRFLKLERARERKVKGSKNRHRANAELGVLRRRLSNRRHDWIEKSTTKLAARYGLASIEDLNIEGMVKKPKPKSDPAKPGAYLPNGASAKSGLAKAIHASQWGKFALRLSDKMDVVKVPAAYTSQCCHECGHTDPDNRKSQAEFRCTRCGHTANADVNAAKNIRELAVCGGTLREWAKARADVNLQRA